MLFTTLLVSLAGLAATMPSAEDMYPSDGGVILQHAASHYFPDSKTADLTKWDVFTHYTGYDAETESWLQSLDPSSGKDDREKAAILVEAAYAKKFSETDDDMVYDRDHLVAAVKGMSMPRGEDHPLDRRYSQYIISHAHVVVWHACSAFFSCVSGASCQFSIDVGKAPRSKCQNQGGQNCCISWSTYKVQAGFFSRTWTNCDAEVENEHDNSASCEGKSDNSGGDVCLSNRGSGCT
ncbi:hypothetical protein VHEMI00037 [[Torrubiella] hemipterigena]|uniref:WD-like domain-containing protein n=1 Tax=[Torrubiella] hemipterigena TaxID=1531966 RepID=A0A0A1T125_9HYPO|nr:hypothetical protein VHEMI00037 [[Torrubiella] hemipterigena]